MYLSRILTTKCSERLVIGRSLVQFSCSACRSVLGQETEPQTAPDALVGTMHGSHCHQSMTIWLTESIFGQKHLLNALNVNANVNMLAIQQVYLHCVSIQGLHPSEAAFKGQLHHNAARWLSQSNGSSKCSPQMQPSPLWPRISQDSLRTRKRSKKERKWRHYMV